MDKKTLEFFRDREETIALDYNMISEMYFTFNLAILYQYSRVNKEVIMGCANAYFLTKKERLEIKEAFIKFIELLKSFENPYDPESSEYTEIYNWINFMITDLTAMYNYKDHDDESNYLAYKSIKNKLPFVCFNFRAKNWLGG